MTTTATPIFPQTITNGVAQILPATTTNPVTLYTAGSNGSKIENIIATTTDSGRNYSLQLFLVINATSYLLCTTNLVASSGNVAGLPGLNLIATSNSSQFNSDSNGNNYLYLASGSSLQVASVATVNSGKVISIIAQAGDF